jgi:hypothetical protein
MNWVWRRGARLWIDGDTALAQFIHDPLCIDVALLCQPCGVRRDAVELRAQRARLLERLLLSAFCVIWSAL